MGMEAKRLGALAVIGARGRAPWAKLTAETKDRGEKEDVVVMLGFYRSSAA